MEGFFSYPDGEKQTISYISEKHIDSSLVNLIIHKASEGIDLFQGTISNPKSTKSYTQTRELKGLEACRRKVYKKQDEEEKLQTHRHV